MAHARDRGNLAQTRIGAERHHARKDFPWVRRMLPLSSILKHL
jgi:hypothetical protein